MTSPCAVLSLSTSLVAVALATAAPFALAQTAVPGPAVPNAGSILQQIQVPAAPAPSSAGTGLSIAGPGASALPPSAPFLVTAIRVVGNTRFDTATLHALVASAEGTSLTLPDLGKLAGRITDYYMARGYPLARAILAAQVIKDGVVTLQVIEARYGAIKLDNQSSTNSALLQATLEPVQSGMEIAPAELDRILLLLSDMPGVLTQATLVPGQAVGTSDLQVNATAAPLLWGNAVFDNYGNSFTGRARLGATLNVANPLHHGDLFTLSALSAGRDMAYGRLAYEAVINGQGTRLGASLSELHYNLGDPLRALNAHGTAQVASAWGRQPFVRSQSLNVYGQVQYDQLQLRDRVDASNIATDRHLKNWTASLSGDVRDALLGGAVTNWNAAWTGGQVVFDNAAAQLANAATAATQGRFSKWNVALSRLQSLTPSQTLYVSLSGQKANGNLDSAQKLTLGGAYSVRAYDTGALSGDSGYLATAELRQELGAWWDGQVQAVAFVDSARVKVNERTWVSGVNLATLSGAGLGLNWAGMDSWNAKLYVAKRLGSAPALVANATLSAPRAWVEISRRF